MKMIEIYFKNKSKFPRKAIRTKQAKIKMLSGFNTLDAPEAKMGMYRRVKIPRIKGIPSIKATVKNTLT